MLKKIIIGVVGIVIIGGAGLFIADRTIFAPSQVTTGLPVAPTIVAATSVPQPAKPTQAAQAAAPAATAPASSAPASGAGKVFKIDAAQSEVHYEVGETFLEGNRFNLAIGRTKGIAGEILINEANPAQSQIGAIVIDVSQFTSDENRRDNFIRRSGLESSKYPQATFKATSIAGLPDKINPGDEVSFTITGDLTVKETTQPVTWQVKLKYEANGLSGQATTQLKMSDFGVGPLKLPILSTEDNVKLVFDFVASPA